MEDGNIQTRLCRICLEEDDKNILIYPCNCSGNSRYVHKECLNQWRLLSTNRDAYNKCFECNYIYNTSNNEVIGSGYVSNILRILSNNTASFFIFSASIMVLFFYILILSDPSQSLISILYYNQPVTEATIFNTYCMWSSLLYTCLLILFVFFHFCKITRKFLYIKYCCVEFYITLILGLTSAFITSMNTIVGIFLINITLQVLLKSHYIIIDKINSSSQNEILNNTNNIESPVSTDTPIIYLDIISDDEIEDVYLL